MNKKYLFVFMAFIGTGCGFDKSKIEGNFISPLSDEDKKALLEKRIALGSDLVGFSELQNRVYDFATKRWLSANLELFFKQNCHLEAVIKKGKDKQECEEAREKCINEIDPTKAKSQIEDYRKKIKNESLSSFIGSLTVRRYLMRTEIYGEWLSCFVSNTDCGTTDEKAVSAECGTALEEKYSADLVAESLLNWGN